MQLAVPSAVATRRTRGMSAILLLSVPGAANVTSARRAKGMLFTMLLGVLSAVAAATMRQKITPNTLTKKNTFGAGPRNGSEAH
eukprot:6961962-Pyramimonas_sp.AAC.1